MVTPTEIASVAARSSERVKAAADPSRVVVADAVTVTTGGSSGPRTVTATSSSWYSPAASVTLRVNRSVVAAVSPVGAVKVTVAAVVVDRVTPGPALRVQP